MSSFDRELALTMALAKENGDLAALSALLDYLSEYDVPVFFHRAWTIYQSNGPPYEHRLKGFAPSGATIFFRNAVASDVWLPSEHRWGWANRIVISSWSGSYLLGGHLYGHEVTALARDLVRPGQKDL